MAVHFMLGWDVYLGAVVVDLGFEVERGRDVDGIGDWVDGLLGVGFVGEVVVVVRRLVVVVDGRIVVVLTVGG